MRYLVLFMLSGVAYTDDKKEEPKVVYKQKTEIDFESVDVVGELVKPQGSLVLERKRAQFNSMIKLRTDFDDLMDIVEDKCRWLMKEGKEKVRSLTNFYWWKNAILF